MSRPVGNPRAAPPASWALLLAAMLWGFAEATLFFVVPDVVVAWAALHRSLRAGLFAALMASLGAAAGGVLIHAWSAADPGDAARVIETVPAIPSGAVARSAEALRQRGIAAPLEGAFRGMPYKVWSAAAPAAGWSATDWLAAAFPIRLPRFLVVALAFAAIGTLTRRRLSRGWTLRLFAAGWMLFYAAYWTLSPW